MPNIQDLQSIITQRAGLAVTNRYQVTFSLPQSLKRIFPEAGSASAQVLNLMCDATSLPGRQISTIDYVSNKQVVKVPYGFINEDVTFTFLLTNDFYAKKVFDAWAKSIMDFKTYRANYLFDHVSDIRVNQMAKGEEQESIIYGVVLKNAYPVTIGNVNLENTAENTIQKFSVVMTYENFEEIT